MATIEELLGVSLSQMTDEELMDLVKSNRQARTYLMEVAIGEGSSKGSKSKKADAASLKKLNLTQEELDDLDL